MLHLVLFRPQIPQNTGNIGRLCAFTQSRLHLVRPLGFTITDRHLRRSGMDYWKDLDVSIHEDWDAFLRDGGVNPDRLWLFTTHGKCHHWNASFADGDGLVFGNEGEGAPQWLHQQFNNDHRLQIPRFDDGLRSLNLSTAAGIATYEALRQVHSPVLPS